MTGEPSEPGPSILAVLSANLKNPYFSSFHVEKAALMARLEAFARLAERERAAVLLCQEVGRGRDFRVDKWLAERLAMTPVYARANGDAERRPRAAWGGREEGLAILSRWPLEAPRTTLLAGGLWRRPALAARVVTPWGAVLAVTTHHSLRPWRNRRQPTRLRAWIEAEAGERAAIIGGDFNAGERAPQLVALAAAREGAPGWVDVFRALHPTGDAATYQRRVLGWTMARRLDYLFVRPGVPGLRPLEARHLTTPGVAFSDHRAVVARLEMGA